MDAELGILLRLAWLTDDEPQVTEAHDDADDDEPPVSAEVLHLLQESGTGEFAAMMHEWLDASALMSQLSAGQGAGSGGLGVLIGAISGPRAVGHSVSALRVGGPRRYQIDHADEPEDGPKTTICDGEHRWQVYGDKVTVGPAVSSPPDMADLADASWLLECRLSGGEPISVDERPAFRLNVARGDAAWSPSLLWFSAAVAVVDAELGILLRLTTYAGRQPVRRYELRDVTAAAGEFRADLPTGLPTVEEEDPVRRFRDGHPPPSINIFQTAASAVGRQVAKEAANVARNLLRRLDGR